jgi:hypothetical protein
MGDYAKFSRVSCFFLFGNPKAKSSIQNHTSKHFPGLGLQLSGRALPGLHKALGSIPQANFSPGKQFFGKC